MYFDKGFSPLLLKKKNLPSLIPRALPLQLYKEKNSDFLHPPKACTNLCDSLPLSLNEKQ